MFEVVNILKGLVENLIINIFVIIFNLELLIWRIIKTIESKVLERDTKIRIITTCFSLL